MQTADPSSRYGILSQALEQLRSALALLDFASAPAHIGAKVDQAIHELDCAALAIFDAVHLDEAAGAADHRSSEDQGSRSGALQAPPRAPVTSNEGAR